MAQVAGQYAAYKQQQKMPVEVPQGVKIIAVLFYIGMVISFLFGIALIIGSAFVGSFMTSLTAELGEGFIPLWGNYATVGFVFLGILMICMGVLDFFVARGLWHGRNWARIVTIIFMVVGFISNILVLITGGFLNGIVGIIIDGAIGGYLLFAPNVKEAFR